MKAPARMQRLSDGTCDAKGGLFLSLVGKDTVRRGVATNRLPLLRADAFSDRAHQIIDIDIPAARAA
jgi:hypothetical protein